MVVLPDADIDMAADAAVSAAYGSAGERCMAVSVVVAVGDVGRPARRRDHGAAPEGEDRAGLDPDVRDGPAHHRASTATRSRRYIDARREQGATVVADGREIEPDGDGFFLGVSLIDDVTPEMDGYQDEIFGPVLSVVRVGDYDEAVRLVNDNPYGNGMAIFTRDGGAARQFQFEVNAGMVGDERPDPGAGRLLLASAAGRPRSSATRTSTGPRGSTSTPAARSSRPLARPGHVAGRSGLPADPLTRVCDLKIPATQSAMDKREEANRAAAEHVERLRETASGGKIDIGRQRGVVDANRDHMADMSRWIEQTDLHLGEERARRQATALRPSGD